MVHDHSGSMNRLVDLNYNSLEALKTACELVPKQKLIIERLPSVRAFSHVERLFDEASLKQREGDEEQSYQLLSRMGVISQLLISKNDFKQFKSTPDGRRFYDLFKTCISRMRELEESLEKRYELKEVEELYRKKEMHQNETTAAISKMVSATNGTTNQQPKLSEIQPESDIGFTITPRQLVRFAESNHQVLIIDYRSVQDSFIKYENVDRVLLAHVPSDAVVPGCIGTSLIRSVAVSERPLLQRMSDVDLVVLLGSERAPKDQDALRRQSKEYILFNALSTYNTTLRLRRAPVFLDGGFDNWKLHYPMFTSDRRSAKRIFCNINDQSEFAKAVAEFKKDLNIQSLQYPDLLHREKPPTTPTAAAAAVPSTPAVPTRPEPPDSSSAAHQQMIYPSMNAEARPSEPAFRPSAAAPSAPSKNASGIATAPSVPPTSTENISPEDLKQVPESAPSVQPSSSPIVARRSEQPPKTHLTTEPPSTTKDTNASKVELDSRRTPPKTDAPIAGDECAKSAELKKISNGAAGEPLSNGTSSLSNQHEPRSHEQRNASSSISGTVSSARPSLPNVDRSSKPTAKPSLSPATTKRNIAPANALKPDQVGASDQSRVRRSANSSPNLDGLAPKPSTLGGARIDYTHQYNPPAQQSFAHPPSAHHLRPVIPDRSAKPHIASSDDVHRLLFLYDSMTKSIQSGAHSKRVNAGYTGLYNLGNTCFMNATLQALFNTRYLKNIFTRDKFAGFVNRGNKMGTSGVISAAFSALMDAVWSGAYSAIRPQQFLETFASEVNASLADRRQHDAQEFQIYLLDALHEDMNRVQRPVSFEQNYTGENLFEEAVDYERRSKKFSSSPVNDIFGCQTVSELQCNTCGSQSVTFEEMTQLSIEIPSGRGAPTLMECINAHFEPVILDRSCKWNCPTCKTLQVSTRRTRIWRLPKILVVHLKRFSFGANGWEKNDSLVHFNCLPLDVGDVVHKDIRKKYPSRSNCFSLYAVTRHSGRLNSGHYTSVVHNEQTKEWLYFDDECVTSINPDSICNKNAFILYFKSHNL